MRLEKKNALTKAGVEFFLPADLSEGVRLRSPKAYPGQSRPLHLPNKIMVLVQVFERHEIQ